MRTGALLPATGWSPERGEGSPEPNAGLDVNGAHPGDARSAQLPPRTLPGGIRLQSASSAAGGVGWTEGVAGLGTGWRVGKQRTSGQSAEAEFPRPTA